MHHSTRGPLPGPWTKLPLEGRGQEVRKLALDLAWSVIRECKGSETLVEAVQQAVDVVHVDDGGQARSYWAGLMG